MDPNLDNSQSFAGITDAILQLRQPTFELPEAEIASLIEEKLNLAYQWFLNCVKALLDWSQPALECQSFRKAIQNIESETKNFFRTLFAQGSTGENVPFANIVSGEQELKRYCEMDFGLFKYCNRYKSFLVCTKVKRKILQECTSGNKSKLLKIFDQEAQGPFAPRGRKDMEELLALATHADHQEVMATLESQIAMDEQLLASKKVKVQETAKTEIHSIFETRKVEPYHESVVSKSLMQSHASLVDFIGRIPSISGAGSSSSQSYVLADGGLVSGVSNGGDIYKKRKPSTSPPRQFRGLPRNPSRADSTNSFDSYESPHMSPVGANRRPISPSGSPDPNVQRGNSLHSRLFRIDDAALKRVI